MMGLGMAVTALPAGWLADRFGRRATLRAGSLVVAVGLLARALSLSSWALFGSTLLIGAGQALVTIAASPFMIENSNEPERTHLFSMHFVVILLGGLLGNLMGGELPGLFERGLPLLASSPLLSYRWALVVGALASALAVWPLSLVREAPLHEREVHPVARARDHAGLLGRLVLNFLLMGMGAGLIMPFFNLYFAQRYGATRRADRALLLGRAGDHARRHAAPGRCWPAATASCARSPCCSSCRCRSSSRSASRPRSPCRSPRSGCARRSCR